MNWREIRKHTNKDLARIDRDTTEKSRIGSELSNILTEGVSLFQTYTQGKADQAALEQFGESEGLTFDKKTKSFYGRQEDGQRYKISPAELKNMQNFGKYTDKGISDFISTKDGNIKKGFQYDLPDTPVAPIVSVDEEESYFSDEDPELPKDNKRIQTVKGDTRASMKVDGKWIGSAKYQEQHEDTLEGWRTAADVDAEFQKNAIAINKAKEDEMKNLLDIQRKKQQEFDAKVVADKKFQEEEKIRIERREKELNEFNSEEIKLEEARKMNLEIAINKNKALKNILPADPNTARGKLQQSSMSMFMKNYGRK